MNLRLIATAAVGLAVGGLIGYKYAEHQLITEFEARLDQELDQIRRIHKTDYSSPEEMVEALHGPSGAEIIKEYAGEKREPVAYDKIRPSTIVIGDKEEKVITRSVFEPVDDRGPIYVITAQEFAENESGYEQVTWNYYAGDGVVTDIHEDRIEDYANYLGTEFVQHFDEDNTVHVRNEAVMLDYEIVRDSATYAQAVLQEEPEKIIRPSQRMGRSDRDS